MNRTQKTTEKIYNSTKSIENHTRKAREIYKDI